MVITVYNISATSARVSWPSTPGCLDTFYSVMYDPNWNSLLMGFKRKSFMHEDRVPVSQTGAYLAGLLPQTTYFLCVTCQAANPAREQCQVFTTPSESGEAHDTGHHLALGVWITSSLLLLAITAFLLWGCLHTVCPLPSWTPESYSMSGLRDAPGSARLYSGSDGDTRQATVIQNPLFLAATSGHVITQEHEHRTVTKLAATDSG